MENKKTYLKWMGLTIIVNSFMAILVYDFYTRDEFMITEIFLFIYGFILLGIYYYKNRINLIYN